jgi:hypothetical protein
MRGAAEAQLVPLWLAMVTSVDTARQQIVRDAVPSSSCENYIGLDCAVVLLAVNAVFSFNNSMAQAGSCAPECRAVSGSVGLLPSVQPCGACAACNDAVW